MKTVEIVSRDACGCEFTTYCDGCDGVTYLTRCRCKKHYNEQFVAKWYDQEGFHSEHYTPTTVVPLEEAGA